MSDNEPKATTYKTANDYHKQWTSSPKESSFAETKSFAKVNKGALIKAVAADNQVEDVQVLHAMKQHGGGFVKALAEAGFQADSVNLQKLKTAWPDYWAEYTTFARADQQREADDRFSTVKNAIEWCGCGAPAGTLKPCIREPGNSRFTCNCCDECRCECIREK